METKEKSLKNIVSLWTNIASASVSNIKILCYSRIRLTFLPNFCIPSPPYLGIVRCIDLWNSSVLDNKRSPFLCVYIKIFLIWTPLSTYQHIKTTILVYVIHLFITFTILFDILFNSMLWTMGERTSTWIC